MSLNQKTWPKKLAGCSYREWVAMNERRLFLIQKDYNIYKNKRYWRRSYLPPEEQAELEALQEKTGEIINRIFPRRMPPDRTKKKARRRLSRQ